MEKIFTEEDLRNAYKAGVVTGSEYSDPHFYELLENEWIDDYATHVQKQEEIVPVTFYTIKNKCGWSKYCDVTGGNHYAINEGFNPDDREIFDVKISHARELGLI